MNRFACLVVAASFALIAGCAAPTEESDTVSSTSTTESAATDDLIDIDPFRLTGLDVTTGTLSGTDKRGVPYSARIVSTTTLRQARLDRYTPVDPCRDLANAFNTGAPPTVDNGYATINALVGSSCKARVLISRSTQTLKSFQPVP